MAHLSTYKDAQGACIIITPALAPATYLRENYCFDDHYDSVLRRV